MATRKTVTKTASKRATKAPAQGAVAPKRAASKSVAGKSTGARPKVARKSASTSNADMERDEAASGDNIGGHALVIVESPAKAKTIGKYLGRGYKVRATIGHVRDLPEKKMGIDVDNGFEPEYVTIPGKEKTLAELKSAARDASEIYLATDPDREGEAIAWHVASQIRRKGGPRIRRVLFHEITKDAVKGAIERAGDINESLVEAQQARRVLDRLVGYKASPMLWKTVKKGVSAGRVQTVALRLIVEREREIRAFKPVEYWTIGAQLEKDGREFTAKLHQIDGKKAEISNGEQARGIITDLASVKTFPVTEVKRREKRKNPSAPYTTSTLQQEAAKKLGYGSKRTMRLAQDLYEGIDIGAEGAVGLITYMRTDSTRVSESAALTAREYLRTLFGAEFLAAGPQLYGDTKAKNTQDAHEAVRPTDPTRRPDAIKRYLSADQFKLYELIWKRFMASQMAPAVFDTTTVNFAIGRYVFRATGSVMKFAGYQALYQEAREAGDSKGLEDEQALPAMNEGESVPVRKIEPAQHFTEPPARFSEASLVKELERLGIGRPSTYASIISTLADRRYVLLEQRRFFPTELGEQVERVMVKSLPDVFNVQFTSNMEGDLDKIEEGTIDWREMLSDFYGPFSDKVKHADLEGLIAEAHDLSGFAKESCPDCGGKLVPRGGFFGPFMACERHPKDCKFTRPLRGDKKVARPTDEKCHECGEAMVIRSGRSGDFLGCSKFPKCRGTRSMPTGVHCPQCGGDVAVRRSKKRGKAFYGCANYPSCDFVVWDKPVVEACPDCGFVGAEAKSTKTRGDYRRCMKCHNEWEAPAPAVEAVVA
ncbi:MAG: type I DNA topoisomerase [Gemmatimonadaceae bacterium]